MCVCVCMYIKVVNRNRFFFFFLFRMAEPEQQLSSEGCICGSVMGSQYMCRTDRGSILQAERWNVQGGSWSRLQRGLNNEFSLSDRLLCAPLPPTHSTKLGY